MSILNAILSKVVVKSDIVQIIESYTFAGIQIPHFLYQHNLHVVENMKCIYLYFSETSNSLCYLVFFIVDSVNSVLCLILAYFTVDYLNAAIILFGLMMFYIKIYIFDEKVSYLISSFLKFVSFPWCASFSYLYSQGIFSMIYCTLELLTGYIYACMVGALKWNNILYVKEVWHSVYSIVPNLSLDSEISIKGENRPETGPKPDLDQKEKNSSQFKEVYVIFVMGYFVTFIVLGSILLLTHK